ncbi:MFS transporter [Roseovarius sp. SYSU LYC5161]|uniref:MFS transporter n=1 Tax=Roseovarius halophilus (ex Wu et al. 2025) TaxID=3376060 RepID=UPI002871FCDC|nr:MFS transporter [Roseovarius sp.]
MTDADILDSRYSWLRMGLSLLVAAVSNVGIWAIVVVMPAMQAEFGTDRAAASLPYTMTMIGFALGNLTIGRLVDRVGMTASLVGATLVMSGATALAALSPSVWTLSAAQMAIGLGTAAGFGPLVADISQWFLKRRGIAVAIVASGNYLAGAIWPLVLAGLLESAGWRSAYLALAVIIPALNLPLALCLRRRVPLVARQHSDSVASIRAGAAGLSPRTITALLWLAGLACCMAMAMPQVHMVSLCVDMGFGAAVGGQILAVMLVAGAASRVFFGLVADRLGGVRTVLISSGLQCLALFLYLPAGGLVSLYAVSLIFGLSQGGIVPTYALVVREYMPSAEAGKRVGIVMMATILGMALGGWVSGWIYEMTGDYRMAFINGIGWNFLNIAILASLLLRTRPRKTVAGTPGHA